MIRRSLRRSESSNYSARAETLNRRVAEAAEALAAQGIRPTVAQVRATLGGGSPNDLAPALKRWKESAGGLEEGNRARPIPVAVADLAQELWQRATAAATLAVKGKADAQSAEASVEGASLRAQITHLRAELEREAALYGELKVQAARHQAIARDALARLEDSQLQERAHLRALGAARARITDLEAKIVAARRPGPPKSKRRVSRTRRAPARKTTRSTKVIGKRAHRKSSRPARSRRSG